MTNLVLFFSRYDRSAATIIGKHAVLSSIGLALFHVAAISLLVIALGRHALNPVLGTCLGLALLIATDIAVIRYAGSFGRFVRVLAVISMITLPLLLCFFHLEHIQRRHATTYFSVSGLMPWSDASGYYLGALSLIERGQVNEFAARRPMGPGMLAVALYLTNNNLNAALWLQTMLVALAMAGAALAMGRRYGIAAAAIMSIGNFAYIENYLQTTMTEPAGFIFGLLSFCLFWRFLFRRQNGDLFWGIALLVISQNIRPGPFLVLPAILLWSGFGKWPACRFSFKTPLTGAAVAAFAVVLCLGGNHAISPPNSTGNGNFAYVLYGMSLGDNSWKKAFTDHPEFFDTTLSESETVKSCYRHAFSNIESNPLPLVTVIGKRLFHVAARPGYFYSMWQEILGFHFSSLFVFGLLFFLAVLNRKTPTVLWFFLSAFAGIICTAPILFDAGLRTYATTIPITNALPALSLGILCLIAARRNMGPISEPEPQIRILFLSRLCAVAMVAIVLIGPFAIKAMAPRQHFSPQYSSKDEPTPSPIIFRASQGTFLHTVADTGSVRFPDITFSNFLTGMPDTCFSRTGVGAYIGPVFNYLKEKEWTFLILDSDPAEYAGQYVKVSAQKISTSGFAIYKGTIIGRAQ